MKVRQPMTESVRNEIKLHIKKGLDISNLIEPYTLKNEVLTGAIIKSLNRVQEDLTNCNLFRAVIGEEGSGKIINLSGCKLVGVNFSYARFVNKVWLRGADLRNSNFNCAWIPDVDFQYADLRNISLCETVIKIGSKSGLHAKMNWKLFKDLAQYLEVDMEQ